MEKRRLFLLDFIRGILLLVMIFYHYSFNLFYFFNYPINLNSTFYSFIPPVFSAFFLLVSGFSTNLSTNSVKRGLYVLFWGIIITFITLSVTPEAPIFFGILHCIGTMMIISSFTSKLNKFVLLFISIGIIFTGSLLEGLTASHNYFLILGITSNTFSSLDYYPILPHGGFFLLGTFLGRLPRPYLLEKRFKNKIGESITFLGRNSLKVYLIHQPIFFLIYFIINSL